MNIQESEIKNILTQNKKICVIGLSPDPQKPSFYVPEYIKNQGWQVVGVYPKPHQAGGFKIYSSFAEVPDDFKLFVNVFRSSDKAPEVIDEILDSKKTNVIWLQLGIQNQQAELKAEEQGLQVISNRCLIIEHKKWLAKS